MRYIVIGNGIGGITSARELSKLVPPESEIMVFSIEDWGYYPKPRLPSFLGDDSLQIENMVVYTQEWYKDLNIQLHSKEKVIAINKVEKKIISEKTEYK